MNNQGLTTQTPKLTTRDGTWVVPVALALTALWAQWSGWDHTLAAWFYDPQQGVFPARLSQDLEQVAHRGARAGLLILWLMLLIMAVLSSVWPRLRAQRRTLWLTVGAMALGPILVSALKSTTTPLCPWDLPVFGGQATLAEEFWALTQPAGHCFPSGHAAAGFSLFALYWAGRASGQRRLQKMGLVLACVVGASLGAVRMAQGAHFLSHNLWSAAIDWLAAQAVFVIGAVQPSSQQSVDDV